MGKIASKENFAAQFKLPRYFHYSWINAAEENAVKSVQQILATPKEQILSRYISGYAEAYKIFQENSGITLTPEQNSLIDLAATETITEQDLRNALSSGVSQAPVFSGGLDGSSNLVNAIAKLSQELKKMNEKMINFNALIDAFLGAKDLYVRIEDSIIGNGGNIRTMTKNKSKVIQEVVQNILNSPDGTTWNSSSSGHVETIAGIGASMNQWLVLLYAVAGGKVSGSTAEAAKQAILKGIKQYAYNLEGAVLEVGTAITNAQASFMAASNINNLNEEIAASAARSFAHLSGDNQIGYTIKVENNKYLQAIMNKAQGQFLSKNKGLVNSSQQLVNVEFPESSMKADQQVWSEDLLLHYDNISVKATTSEKTLRSGEKRIGELKIQSGTNLQTALLRELEFSAEDVVGLLQIALANGSGSVATKTWQQLRKYLQMAMLVPALSGLGKENGMVNNLVTKVKINDYLIPMPQLLNYIQFALARQFSLDNSKFTGSISLKGLPSVGKFQELNTWEGDSSVSNGVLALKRSKRASTAGFNLLQSTKLDLRLRNLNLTLLLNSGAIL